MNQSRGRYAPRKDDTKRSPLGISRGCAPTASTPAMPGALHGYALRSKRQEPAYGLPSSPVRCSPTAALRVRLPGGFLTLYATRKTYPPHQKPRALRRELNRALGAKFRHSTLHCGGLRGGLRRHKTKKPLSFKGLIANLAERVGFEPTVPCSTPDFESGTFDHSATSPQRRA